MLKDRVTTDLITCHVRDISPTSEADNHTGHILVNKLNTQIAAFEGYAVFKEELFFRATTT